MTDNIENINDNIDNNLDDNIDNDVVEIEDDNYIKYKKEYSNKFILITKNHFKEGLQSIYDNVNFILPLQNLDDIKFIKENLSILEETDLSRLVDNYNIRNSTVVILRLNEKKLDVFLKSNLSGLKKIKKLSLK